MGIALRFQSTHPLRGATQIVCVYCGATDISIHAPLAGCDELPAKTDGARIDFNPRTPCGVRQARTSPCRCRPSFQSTHPLRGATKSRRNHPQHYTFQSTHPLRGATFSASSCDRMARFQSTHPLRGATNMLTVASGYSMVSIHAPLAGCDQLPARMGQHDRRFNPRTPCGVRLSPVLQAAYHSAFQSTHPLRGATNVQKNNQNGCLVSIHAPLAGCD